MNRVILSGRLTRDVETKSGNNTTFARASIAVDRPTKNKECDFFNLVAFGKTAEIMSRYLQKGSKILIDGHLNFSQYEDKDGNKKNTVNVIVDNFEFMDGKAANKSQNANMPFDPDDIAF